MISKTTNPASYFKNSKCLKYNPFLFKCLFFNPTQNSILKNRTPVLLWSRYICFIYNSFWVIMAGFKICNDQNGNVICQIHSHNINIIRSMQMKQPKLIIRVLSSSMDDDGSKKHILHLVHHVFVPIIQQKNEGKGEKTKWYSREVIGAITCVDIITTLNTTFDISKTN